MNVSELNNVYIYIEDAMEIEAAGSISSPTRVTLSETDGAVILDEFHYANFDGKILLDLAEILKGYSSDFLPTGNWEGNEASCLDLTLTVGVNSYQFTFNAASKESRSKLSDIDFLFIPEGISIPVSVLCNQDQGVKVFIESSAGRNLISEHTFTDIVSGQYCRTFDISTLPTGAGPFQFICEISGHNTFEVRSPMYKIQPGEYQLYLFRNRFGALELFPMRGSLEFSPTFRFESGSNGHLHKKTSTECDDILRQNSGNITRKASQVLASFLKEGHAYHLVGGEWKRIVIEEASVITKSLDTTHRQSFSFRYQDPIDPQFMMI